jgi:hypothetical protein
MTKSQGLIHFCGEQGSQSSQSLSIPTARKPNEMRIPINGELKLLQVDRL